MKKLLLLLLLIAGCTTEPEDCAGVVGGNSYLDECGGCDANVNNDCIQDCSGEWGGNAVEDEECGLCSAFLMQNADSIYSSIVGNWEIDTTISHGSGLGSYLQITNDSILHLNISHCMDALGNPATGDCTSCFSSSYALNEHNYTNVKELNLFLPEYVSSTSGSYDSWIKNDNLIILFKPSFSQSSCYYQVYKPSIYLPECDNTNP